MRPPDHSVECKFLLVAISFRHMNLHHLSLFFGIAEAGNISEASKRLYITQPALSRQLKDFEERLGVVLFERLPRGMRLTHAGEVLREYAARLFAIEHAAEAAVREIANVGRGRLDLGASNTIGTYVLPAILAAYRQRFPGIVTSLFVGNTEQVARGVADLRFSLGFIEGPLQLAELHSDTFMRDEIVPVVAATHELAHRKRVDLSSLEELPLLMREEGSGTRELVAALLEENGVKPKNVMHFGNTEALKQAALHGGGIVWLPRLCMIRELAEGLLKPLHVSGMTIRREFRIVMFKGGHISPPSAAFLDLLKHATALQTPQS